MTTDVDEQEAIIRPRLWRMTGKYPVPGFGGWPPTRIQDIPHLQENIELWEQALADYRKAERQRSSLSTVRRRRAEALKKGQWVLTTLAAWDLAVEALEKPKSHQKARRKDAQTYRWYVIEGRRLRDLIEELQRTDPTESGLDEQEMSRRLGRAKAFVNKHMGEHGLYAYRLSKAVELNRTK